MDSLGYLPDGPEMSGQPSIGDIQLACPHPADVPVTHPAFEESCCRPSSFFFDEDNAFSRCYAE